MEAYFGVDDLLYPVHDFDIASLLTKELEAEFLVVGDAGTDSDEISLFAEGHVHPRGRIAGGTVKVGLVRVELGRRLPYMMEVWEWVIEQRYSEELC